MLSSQNKSKLPNELHWTCPRCRLLLGKIDNETRETLRIKVGKTYYWVLAKGATATCKRCGSYCELDLNSLR